MFSFFQKIKSQIGAWLKPATDFIKPYLAPLTSRWEVFKRDHPTGAKWTRRAGRVFLFFFSIYLIFDLGVFGEVPSVSELKDLQSQTASEVYSADGVLLGRYYLQNRTNIEYKDIPKHLINALVATEDARFFEHSGIDMRSWARVLLKSIILNDDSSGGGSTISQQLAKNLFPRIKYRFFSLPINKLREMLIATRLERAYSKEELLTLYLNTVPFGNNAFGVEVASKRFFSTQPINLKIEDAALMVGTLKATTYYNPVKYPERARKRRNIVLDQMVKYNYLRQDVCDSLKQLPVTLQFDPKSDNVGMAPYFREYLRNVELPRLLENIKKPDGTPYNIYTDGLKIYTTLNSKMQGYAEEAVEEHMTALQKTFDNHWRGMKAWGNDTLIMDAMKASPRYQDLKEQGMSEKEIEKVFNKKIPMTVFTWNGEEEKEMSPLDSIKYYFCLLTVGFVAMEPQSGYIRAWVGGDNFNYFQYDHVRAKRQVGSVFKPIVYATAVKSGIRPCEYIPNRLITYDAYEGWQPKNADGKYGGSYSMEGALTNSVNVVSVGLIMKTGIEPVIQLAKQMGITSDIPHEPSIALGTANISLYEMITAFGTFANRGVRPEPIAVTRIERQNGEVVAKFDPPGVEKLKRVLSVDEADIMIKMMQSVTQGGTAGRLRWQYQILNDIAGKTGTSQNHSDGWFVGYSPNLVAGVWVGGESPAIRFRDFAYGQGAYTALPVWGMFMRKVYDDPEFAALEQDKFPAPSQAVLDSLDCPHRSFSPEEQILMDSLNQLKDSLDLENPDGTENPEGGAPGNNGLGYREIRSGGGTAPGATLCIQSQNNPVKTKHSPIPDGKGGKTGDLFWAALLPDDKLICL